MSEYELTVYVDGFYVAIGKIEIDGGGFSTTTVTDKNVEVRQNDEDDFVLVRRPSWPVGGNFETCMIDTRSHQFGSTKHPWCLTHRQPIAHTGLDNKTRVCSASARAVGCVCCNKDKS